MFRPAGSYSTNTSTWTADTQILSAKQSKNVNFTELLNYNHGDKDDKDDDDSPLWMVLMDQSQLIMTIVGLAANMATTSVLIKNGQVVILENKHRWIIEDFFMGPIVFSFSGSKIRWTDLVSWIGEFFYR